MDDEAIFVSISAYRDPECLPTIRDLYARAARPGRVYVGVCWQGDGPGDDALLLDRLPASDRVRVVRHAIADSGGCSWAKHEAQRLWRGEPYQLTIDSHMRFHAGWDDTLLAMLAACDSIKPVLSTYPACYDPPNDMGACQTPLIVPRAFEAEGESGALYLDSVNVYAEDDERGPRPAAFLAGGFLFSAASFLEEVPFDPHLYFVGLELSLSVRAFTRGWDAFAPNRCALHHYYRQQSPKHWEDRPEWYTAYEVRSQARVRHLVGMQASHDPAVLTEIADGYGLGAWRSLADFERFAGIDFAARTIDARGREGRFGDA